MKIERYTGSKPEETIPISAVAAGEVFRFACDSFQEALTANLFFMRLESPVQKDSVTIVNVHDGKQLVRDSAHRVVPHEVTLSIK